MSTEDLDYDGWPTTKGFARTESEAFRDETYGAAIERPFRRRWKEIGESIFCALLFVLMAALMVTAPIWWPTRLFG